MSILLAGNLVYAGGSGLNTVVIVNQNSTNSVELGNYFCERRQVPPENLLRIYWAGPNNSWSSDQFQTNLLNQLLLMLANRQLTNQVDYVVLSMDIPFQVVYGTAYNGTTSGLFYGLKSDQSLVVVNTNSYAGSEAVFAQNRPASAPGYSFLTVMLTAGSLAQAKALVDHGVAGDSSFPSQRVVLAKTSDYTRNVRYHEFDNSVFNTRVLGDYSLQRTNTDSPWGQTNLLGYQTGLAYFGVSSNAFVPGAMADSLTSYGGIIFGYNDQSNLLTFIHAGAAGSYGTVTEPSPTTQKFPNPLNYFYQARGFSLAECYYQSLYQPALGLIVAEPLSAPFAQPGSGRWTGISSNALLSGTAPLAVSFTASDSNHPLQQVDLFVDGKFFQTVTNLGPHAGNLLAVSVNNVQVNYTVPAGASLTSVASGLASALNDPLVTNSTHVTALALGDRIELHSLSTNVPPSSFSFIDTQSQNYSRRFYRALPLVGGVPQPALSPAALGGGYGLHIDNVQGPYLLQASTDLKLWTPMVTNLLAGNVSTFGSSSLGQANVLSTFLRASRAAFLGSPATGLAACSINGSVQVGTWLQLSIIKTNGQTVSVAATNQTVGAVVMDFAEQFCNVVNSTPALQGSDGLLAQDLAAGFLGAANFNLSTRSPGLQAALLQVQLSSSSDLAPSPAGQTNLTANLSDLQPRNHLYVTAGANNLNLTFPLNTAALSDGFHTLSAIAYEGTDVRTQTRVTVPVQVKNSPLSATLSFLDLIDPAPVQRTYHIRVIANTNAVSAIRLYTTGGLFARVLNQSATTFTVNGATLGPGLHPFYALVDPVVGPSYRTDTKSVRLVSGP